MPTYAWILIWAVAIGTVAFLALRERRASRRMTADVDRLQFDAQKEAGVRSDLRGPNTFGGFGG